MVIRMGGLAWRDGASLWLTLQRVSLTQTDIMGNRTYSVVGGGCLQSLELLDIHTCGPDSRCWRCEMWCDAVRSDLIERDSAALFRRLFDFESCSGRGRSI